VFAQLGKVSKLKIDLPQLFMAKVMERMPMIFMTIPVLACGYKQIFELPKLIVLHSHQ